VYRFDVSLAPRQWAIAPGHQVRLELTTQSPADICPPDAVPPKNGTDPCRLTAPQQATLPGGVYTVLHGPRWPSTLNLPQLPWKALHEVPATATATGYNEGNRRLEASTSTLPLDWGGGE